MRVSDIESIRCPLCGSSTELSTDSTVENDRVTYGTIVCDCNRYPIIDSILRIDDGPLTSALVTLIERGRHEAALTACLEWPSFSLRRRVRNRVARELLTRSDAKYNKLSNLIRGSHRSTGARDYLEACDAFDNPLEQEWNIHRFSMPSFRPFYVLAGAVRGGKVLDIGSGAGHGTALIATLVGDKNVVALDNCFAHLHLAKRFLVPDGVFICADATQPMPFRNDYFDVTACYDMLQCLPSKLVLAREIDRITASDGLAFLRVHNARIPHEFGGRPLTREGYARLLEARPVVALTENEIIERGSSGSQIDLRTPSSEKVLDESLGFCLLQTTNPERLESIRNPWQQLSRNAKQLRVNPSYTVTRSPASDEVKLTRKSYSEGLADILRTMPDLVATDGSLSSSEVEGSSRAPRVVSTDIDRLSDLMMKGLIIPVSDAFATG